MSGDDLDRRHFLKVAAATGLSAALGDTACDSARHEQPAEQIPRRLLGRTGLYVTAIGLGGYHASVPEAEEDTMAIIHRALDLGVNFFDNADCYHEGRAEERMGKALEGYRQKIVLMTKVDQRDAQGSRETLERSLLRLRTDYLDIWQFHAVDRKEELDQILGPGGAMETAEQAKKEGKVRFIGITGHVDSGAKLEAIQRYPFDTIQIPINVVDPNFSSFQKIVLEEAGRRHVGVIAMKSLAGGSIVSQELATVEDALSWVWNQPVGVLVSGCDRRDHLDYNVRLTKDFKALSQSEQAALLTRRLFAA